ncbi:hypothetical protein CR513_15991, partial [Mucuna pruriens]
MDGQFDQNHGKVAATPTYALTTVVTSPCGEKSPYDSPNDGGHHVYFGTTVEMENNDRGQEHHHGDAAENK